MEYLFQGKLDNAVHDITYDQIKILYEDNMKEEQEANKITLSSYGGENYYDQYGDHFIAIGRKVAWDSVLSSLSFLISVLLVLYSNFLGISGTVFKTVFVLLGIVMVIL